MHGRRRKTEGNGTKSTSINLRTGKLEAFRKESICHHEITKPHHNCEGKASFDLFFWAFCMYFPILPSPVINGVHCLGHSSSSQKIMCFSTYFFCHGSMVIELSACFLPVSSPEQVPTINANTQIKVCRPQSQKNTVTVTRAFKTDGCQLDGGSRCPKDGSRRKRHGTTVQRINNRSCFSIALSIMQKLLSSHFPNNPIPVAQ
jgi:hypothetical protein